MAASRLGLRGQQVIYTAQTGGLTVGGASPNAFDRRSTKNQLPGSCVAVSHRQRFDGLWWPSKPCLAYVQEIAELNILAVNQ